jgi:hypothetical protein
MQCSRSSTALCAALMSIISACDGSRDAIGPNGLPRSAQLDHGANVCVAGVAGLVVSVDPKELAVGGQAIFYGSVLDGAGGTLPGTGVEWSIADTSIVARSADSPSGHPAGIARKAGTTVITASCGSITASANITVTGGDSTTPTPTGVTVEVTVPTNQLTPGQTTQAEVRLQDATGHTVVAPDTSWSTSNGSVVTVNDNGVVTALSSGTATVSATLDGVTGGANVSVGTATTPAPPPPTGVDPGSGVTAVTPELPRASVDARYVAPTGRTIDVPAGADLQAAVDGASRGDVILLAPGASYFGPVTLPAKPGSGWITIRTAAPDGSLPSDGQRITPSYAGQLPKLVGGGANAPVLRTASGASGYRLMGIEITAASSIGNLTSLVELGEGGDYIQKTLADVPTDLVLDRVYVHGQSATNLQRCIALNSARTAIVNSWITECHGREWDTQAIAGWNGPGPYLIENNQLEGSGENIMFGGADAVIGGLTPSDITIRRNHVRKPAEWQGAWLVKNLLELKHAKRVLVEANVFENNWANGQDGVAIVLKSTNQGGTNPWAQTADVTFRYNIIRNSPQAVNIAAMPDVYTPSMIAVPATRFLFEHNLFENIGSFNGSTNGNMLVLTNYLSNVTFSHNTMHYNYANGLLMTMESLPVLGSARNIVVNDNVVTKARYYQLAHSGIKVGTESLNAFAGSSWAFSRNVVIGVDPEYVSWHPQSSFYPTTMSDAGFAVGSNGDYRLSGSSPYKGRATDGTDPGANFDELNRRISGVVVR